AYNLLKLVRYARIYGPRRAVIKAMGRTRRGKWIALRWSVPRAKIGLIGCGQFAFSTLAFFILEKGRIVNCYDIDPRAANSLARVFRVGRVSNDYEAVIRDEEVDCVYIASNHSTHAQYAAA